MPGELIKVGPKGWSHGWVWNGPGPMPRGAPPQATMAHPPKSTGDHDAGDSGREGGGVHKPAPGPAHGTPAPKPRPGAPVHRPSPGGGSAAEAAEHARANSLRAQANTLDNQANTLAAAGKPKKTTTTPKKPTQTKPANAKKPAAAKKPSTATQVANLRSQATALRNQASGLDQQAAQVLAKSTNPYDPITRRHVAHTTAVDELTYFSFPISKFEKTDDGDLVVYGKATDGSVDSDEQIVDPEWSAKALTEWSQSGGNVRVQHQAMRDPAGKAISVEIDRDGDSGHWVKSLVVEPVAKRLVEKGVLTAYSVGIARPIIRRDPTGKARGGVVAGGSLAELSLVDRPANKACGLMLAKSANGPKGEIELVGELFGDPEFLAKASTEQDLLTKSAAPDDDEADLVKDKDPAATAGGASAAATGQADSDNGINGQDGIGGDDATDEDDTSADTAISKADDPTKISYRRERNAWLAREPAVKSAVGGTEYLQRRAAWLRWNAEGEADGLTGTREGALLWLAKRGIEPDLVKRDFSAAERDAAADSGAAMADGSFPIHNAEDLGNAIPLAGHAKDPAAARAHIKSRAAALELEDKIPDNWKTEAGEPTTTLAELLAKGVVTAEDATTMLGASLVKAANDMDGNNGVDVKAADTAPPCKTCKGDGKIMGGQRDCPDCGPAAKAGDQAEVVKGSKDCKKCGKSYDSDAGVSFCGNCGKKLPPAGGTKKAEKAAAPITDADLLALADTVSKTLQAGLITQAAADEIIAVAAEKAKRTLPADTATAGTHREPDGTSTVEQMEPDAGLPTKPDKTPDKVPVSVQGVGEGMTGQKPPKAAKGEATYSLTRMHDALCAAYSGPDVLAEYPSLKSVTDAVDEAWLAGEMSRAAAAGKAKKTARLAALVDAAQALKGMDPAAVEDGRAHLAKSFTDLYPTEHIKPGDARKPGSFQRPYLTAGHAAEDAGHNGGSNIPPAAHTPEPEGFRRPLITTDHEADSPANKEAGDIRTDAPVRTGASRVFYSNAQREAARVAMQAIHDHISGNFPDMCPMAASKSVLPPDMGARNIPTVTTPHIDGGVGGAVKTTTTAPEAQLSQIIADAIKRHGERANPGFMTREQVEKAARDLGLAVVPEVTAVAPVAAAPAGLTADQVKAILTEHTDPYTSQIDDLRKQLEDLASRPDPAMAPVRGALAKAAPGAGSPVERRSLVDEAAGAAAKAREQAAADEAQHYRFYIETLTKSPDPGTREKALTVLNKLDGA